MAAIAGQLSTMNLGNFVGELYQLSPTETAFASRAAANGVKRIAANKHTWTVTDLPARSQDAKLEGDDATFSGRDSSPRTNIVQIHHEGVEMTYSKMADTGSLSDSTYAGISTDAPFLLGSPNRVNTLAYQLTVKMEKIAGDVNYTFINGEYADPADHTVNPRQTRGILEAVALNAGSVTNGSTFTDDAALKAGMDAVVLGLVNRGARVAGLTIWVDAFQKQRISRVYGYEPTDRTVAGVAIDRLLTDFGWVDIAFERDLPAGTQLWANMSLVQPVHRPIPGKGLFFTEQLAKTGSAEKYQVYGEIGLEYGPHEHHAVINNLPTS